MEKIAHNFDYLCFFNWQGRGKGDFEGDDGYINKEKLGKSITLPTLRKMIFCFIKLALSPLYLFYLFFSFFLSFLEALNLLNFFRSIAQIFILIIGLILTCSIIFSPAGIGILQYAFYQMTYEKDDNNRKIDDVRMEPVLSVIYLKGGMMFPLQIVIKVLVILLDMED